MVRNIDQFEPGNKWVTYDDIINIKYLIAEKYSWLFIYYFTRGDSIYIYI